MNHTTICQNIDRYYALICYKRTSLLMILQCDKFSDSNPSLRAKTLHLDHFFFPE